MQYRLAEPGEVLPAGGKVVTMLDVSDVYMTLFLPETLVGTRRDRRSKRASCSTRRLSTSFPRKVSYVAAEAQFTPKTVETASERQKLAFRVKAQIDPELLRKYRAQVKTGLPGVAYVRFDAHAEWPPACSPDCRSEPLRREPEAVEPVARAVAGRAALSQDTWPCDDVDLDIPAGCVVGLIGPDGVGKSSLLALIAGARKIQHGEVQVLGGDMRGCARIAAHVCTRIAYMPQGLGKNLYPTLSVFRRTWTSSAACSAQTRRRAHGIASTALLRAPAWRRSATGRWASCRAG